MLYWFKQLAQRKIILGMRSGLVLLVLVAVLPSLGIIFQAGLEERKWTEDAANEQALAFSRQAKANHEALISNGQHLLAALAQLSAVQTLNASACNDLFAELLLTQSYYTALAAEDLSGDIFCSAAPLAQPTNVSDREYFQKVLQTRQFIVSDYMIGRLSGKAVITLNHPVLNEQGELAAVITAGLDLAWLNAFISNANLPEGSIINVIDSTGMVLAHFPDSGEWVGTQLPENHVLNTILFTREEGTFQGSGLDGVSRLYAYTPLQTGQGLNAFVVVGIPTGVAFARVNERWQQNVAFLVLALGLAVAAAWGMGNLIFVKNTKRLIHAAGQLAAGKEGVRSGLQSNLREFGQLASAFDGMAVQIERQRTELSLAETKYRSFVEQMPAVTYLISLSGNGEILYISPQATALLGFSNEQWEDNPDLWRSRIHPEDWKEIHKLISPGLLAEKLVAEYRLINAEGQVLWVNDVASVICDEHGQPRFLQGMVTDITERKHTEAALAGKMKELACLQAVSVVCVEAKSENELLERASQIIGSYLFSQNFGVMLLDEALGLLLIHPSYRMHQAEKPVFIPVGKGITGQTARDGLTRRIADVTHEPGYIYSEDHIHSELCAPLKVGSRIFGVFNAESAQIDAFSEADEHMIVSLADQLALALERLRTEKKLEELATIDELTKVLNRRGFLERGERECKRAQRFNRPLTALMLDVDRFKEKNDHFGHATGDQVLQEVSSRFKDKIRDIDLIGRLGGDEFAILLVETGLSEAHAVAERIRQIVTCEPVVTQSGPMQISVSLGVAQILNPTELKLNTLLAFADKALYEAKNGGRNQVVVKLVEGSGQGTGEDLQNEWEDLIS